MFSVQSLISSFQIFIQLLFRSVTHVRGGGIAHYFVYSDIPFYKSVRSGFQQQSAVDIGVLRLMKDYGGCKPLGSCSAVVGDTPEDVPRDTVCPQQSVSSALCPLSLFTGVTPLMSRLLHVYVFTKWTSGCQCIYMLNCSFQYSEIYSNIPRHM